VRAPAQRILRDWHTQPRMVGQKPHNRSSGLESPPGDVGQALACGRDSPRPRGWRQPTYDVLILTLAQKLLYHWHTMKNLRKSPFENRSRGIATMPVLLACCGAAVALSLGLFTAERNRVRALDRERIQTAAALDEAKSQIQDLAGRLKTLTEKAVEPTQETVVPPAPAPAAILRPLPADSPLPVAPRTPAPVIRRKPSARPVIAVDRRLDRLQGQLTETQKQ